MSPQPILARVRNYDDLQAAMRARAEQLNISRIEIDRRGKMPEGHAAKLLAPHPSRYLGVKSMAKLLDALGLELLAVERSDWHRIEGKRDASSVRIHGIAKYAYWTPQFVRKIGAKGGIARAKKLSPFRRRQIARRAIKARWHPDQNRVNPPPTAKPSTKPP